MPVSTFQAQLDDFNRLYGNYLAKAHYGLDFDGWEGLFLASALTINWAIRATIAAIHLLPR